MPRYVFEQIRRHFSCLLSGEISQLSEQDLIDQDLPIAAANIEKFTLWVTDQGGCLLLAQPAVGNSYSVCLCTEKTEIARFLSLPWLANGLKPDCQSIWSRLQQLTERASSMAADRGALDIQGCLP
ncbi:MAG: hypothetical protein AAGA83_19380 [Cyanobacteria bacterium P01_F01_bin.116]